MVTVKEVRKGKDDRNMTDKTENKAVENAEIKAAAEKPEAGRKKKKGRKKKIFKRLFWTFVILLVLGVTAWSTVSRLQSEYRTTYDP